MSRSYDYAMPYFGGGFTCAPPPVNTTRSDRAGAYASSRTDSVSRSRERVQEFLSNSRQSSFSRSDSLSKRPPLTRMESLGRTAPATVTTSSEYSIGSDGRPSHYSSTTYKSPYGNNYRTSSHY